MRRKGMRMSQVRYTRADAAPPAGGRTFHADLNFLSRWAGPLGLLARAMLAYIFILKGAGKIANYAGVAGHMQAHGVPCAKPSANDCHLRN
jgi:hypothetical protein